jgi:hypothetical protein
VPVLGGYLIYENHLGPSALLLATGFFLLLLALEPLLHKEVVTEPRPAPGWQVVLPLGLSAILSWTSMYGPYPSGLVLACPGALWLLSLATEKPLKPHAVSAATRAHLAWTTLLGAIVVASAI